MAAAKHLIEALCAFYRGAGREGDSGAERVLDDACAALERCVDFNPLPAPRSLLLAALLPPALANVNSVGCRPLRDAIGAAAHLFRWRQNPNYSASNMGAAFMAGYGYVEFAGPKDALLHDETIRAGLLVLAPGLHYPAHAHPAEEVYHPLTSGAVWRRAAEPWRQVEAGSAIHHRPMVEHETRAGAETLLALYCWRGDTSTEARLSV